MINQNVVAIWLMVVFAIGVMVGFSSPFFGIPFLGLPFVKVIFGIVLFIGTMYYLPHFDNFKIQDKSVKVRTELGVLALWFVVLSAITALGLLFFQGVFLLVVGVGIVLPYPNLYRDTASSDTDK